MRSRDLDWTIVRPGGLTNDPGTGRVLAGPTVPRGRIPRADVAATIAALLTTGAASRTQFELVSGDDPIDDALAASADALQDVDARAEHELRHVVVGQHVGDGADQDRLERHVAAVRAEERGVGGVASGRDAHERRPRRERGRVDDVPGAVDVRLGDRVEVHRVEPGAYTAASRAGTSSARSSPITRCA